MKKTKKEPTLIEQLYRQLLMGRNLVGSGVTPEQIKQSTKYTLDTSMSSFLADLGNQMFTKEAKDLQLMDALRVSARLPHELTWVEFNMRVRMRRLVTEYDRNLDPEAAVGRMGWMLEQHPKQETAFRATIAYGSGMAADIPDMQVSPFFQNFALMWTVDNSPLPWPSLKFEAPTAKYIPSGEERPASVSEVLTGVFGYNSPYVGVTRNSNYSDVATKSESWMIREQMGELRYIFAFLASILDVPTTITNVQGHGFVARGRYRKPLEHKIITLKVPDRSSPKRIAQKALVGIKRRGGPVRGHWRTYLRFGAQGEPWCQRPHTMEDWVTTNDPDHQRCRHCNSFRTWIREYIKPGTGGNVTHDYLVKHD